MAFLVILDEIFIRLTHPLGQLDVFRADPVIWIPEEKPLAVLGFDVLIGQAQPTMHHALVMPADAFQFFRIAADFHHIPEADSGERVSHRPYQGITLGAMLQSLQVNFRSRPGALLELPRPGVLRWSG